jgi:hypothetical protein
MLPTRPDAGVVDQDVEVIERRECGIDGGFVGNVAKQDAGAGQFGRNGSGARGIDRHDDDGRARRGEGARDRFADTAGSAGDQGDAPV